MDPKGGHVKFASDPMQLTLRQTSEKNKFIANIYVRFNQNLDEQSYILNKNKNLGFYFIIPSKLQ